MTHTATARNEEPFLLPEPSIGRESYMHRAAKEVVVRWLREAAAEAGHDNYANVGGLIWRVNRGGPAWGIWQEYPFTPEKFSEVWDERLGMEFFQDAPPSPEWCLANGFSLACVADVAVQHKGLIKAVVEITHCHPVSEAKRDFYSDHHIAVWEVDASWVLRQTGRPEKIRCLWAPQ